MALFPSFAKKPAVPPLAVEQPPSVEQLLATPPHLWRDHEAAAVIRARDEAAKFRSTVYVDVPRERLVAIQRHTMIGVIGVVVAWTVLPSSHAWWARVIAVLLVLGTLGLLAVLVGLATELKTRRFDAAIAAWEAGEATHGAGATDAGLAGAPPHLALLAPANGNGAHLAANGNGASGIGQSGDTVHAGDAAAPSDTDSQASPRPPRRSARRGGKRHRP